MMTYFILLPALLGLLALLFLIYKRWVSLTLTVILLIFTLVVESITQKETSLQHLEARPAEEPASHDAFRKQMVHAVEELKLEMDTERENLQRVVNQVQEVVDSFDLQKKKLQQFIEETREQFQPDYSPPSNRENATETPS